MAEKSNDEYAKAVSETEGSINFECPSCGYQKAYLNQKLLQIPYYEDFHAVIMLCPECGMRKADFANLNSKGATRYIYRADEDSDGETKVVRSIEGTVYLPEAGIAIRPATSPTSWIRNVEGIMLDIIEKLEMVLSNPENSEEVKRRVNERMLVLRGMAKGELPVTLVVEDPTGNSVIIPAKEEKLEIRDYNPEEPYTTEY